MITFDNIHKSFGTNHVLQGVDLQVKRGESMVVIGGSGSGKSILIKTVLGLVKPDQGHIEVDLEGNKSASHQDFLDHFGMLFQSGALFDSLSIWQNVSFRLLRAGQRKVSKATARDIAIEKLQRVGLGAEVADVYPAELSGGMQKRVGLARAIATDPDIIFFDEPTAGLDPIMSGVINDLIRRLVVEMKATAITITHDMRSVRAIADRVAMLYEGKIKWCGPVDTIDAGDDPYVHQFINGLHDGPIETVR